MNKKYVDIRQYIVVLILTALLVTSMVNTHFLLNQTKNLEQTVDFQDKEIAAKRKELDILNQVLKQSEGEKLEMYIEAAKGRDVYQMITSQNEGLIWQLRTGGSQDE